MAEEDGVTHEKAAPLGKPVGGVDLDQVIMLMLICHCLHATPDRSAPEGQGCLLSTPVRCRWRPVRCRCRKKHILLRIIRLNTSLCAGVQPANHLVQECEMVS